MNRKIIVAAVLVVLLAVSVCGVYLLKEDVRSELVMEPVYVNGSNYGITVLEVGENTYRDVSIDHHLQTVYRTDDGFLCSLNIYADEAEMGYSFQLSYEYESMGDLLVPVGSEFGHSESIGDHYAYIDPVTGDRLLFQVFDGSLGLIHVEGRTVVESEEGLEYADFSTNMSASYSRNYTNGTIHMEPESPTTIEIVGTENGVELGGTVIVDPYYAEMNYKSFRQEASVSIGIEGSSLPGFITDFRTSFYNSEVSYSHSDHNPFLMADGRYCVPSVESRLTTDDGTEFVLEGTVTFYELDGNCDIVSEEIIEFSYGVV